MTVEKADSGETETGGAAVTMIPALDLEKFERGRRLLLPIPEITRRIDGLLRSGNPDVSWWRPKSRSSPGFRASSTRRTYSVPRQISGIKQAIAFRGFSEIHRLVLTSSVADAVKDANPLHLRRFWTHC